jgi:hypothetical protein
MILSFDVQLTQEEFKNYFEYLFVSSPKKKKALIQSVVRIGLLEFMMIMILLYIISDNQFRINALLIALLVSAGLSIFTYFRFANNVRKQASRAMDEAGGDIYTARHEYLLSEKGIQVSQSIGEFLYYWPAFIKMETSKGCTYLFLSSRQALIIPHRVLDSQEKKKMFDTLLATHLSVSSAFSSLLAD